ncbi:Na+/H+ antiporter NhaC family protein [Metabacillus litoralis]|uniref:Na+/H+ antiporter NhaC family protein n=1 Tax=Metabacillus TaxID=2675233 RepID=UPI000EF608A1|nr:Na+/H+ antiporter NhaC family protein [Metabacillus litoralis]MCM3161193.1 Na+/H+ antiporter NhaC family protein [Metabacillus litoralis]MCM3412067.1 Na+/H+ antiporter NhaC family protein [Metabacillus litoralis]
MSGTIFSIIPPIIAILMVILTRRVLLSLGVGIVSAALLLKDFSIADSGMVIINAVKGIFISEGELNTWNVYIILFLLILGIVTALISISGGSRAFGEWAQKRVKTRTGAQFTAAILGILIFIDDYFNALAVGQVSRPITDRQKVSRAKLAYIIDSTSAPVCVVSPISSWGAYIIAMIATILTTHGVTEFTPLGAFMTMIPMNYYVFAALVLVFAVAYFNINIGSMKVHEDRAIQTGQVVDPSKEALGEIKEDLPTSDKGTIGNLVWPILSLIIGTVASMLYTGYSAIEDKSAVDIFAIFENTDVSASLLYGGLFGLAITIILFFSRGINGRYLPLAIIEGVKSMLPAIYILLFAWVIVDLIGQLSTGEYLAGIVEKSNLNLSYLPVVMFILAAFMAFATGTSWGTFGIMLPIAGEITAATDINMLLAAMAAVLAGSVLGDHCSPISDTTILSSTGAGSHHIDHVLTQLPYALIGGGVATIGYLVLGFTGSSLVGLLTISILLVGFIFIFAKRAKAV